MHNNYFFLQSLANSLAQAISGGRISDCYTQDKNELILTVSVSGKSFTLRAYLQPSFSCLFFPEEHKRAKRNTVDVLKSVIGKKINGVKQHLHERAFSILLENDFHLTFKMFGNRANAVLFQGNETVDIFRSKLKQDFELKWDELDRELNLSEDAFHKTYGNPTHFLPVLGKILTEYLFESGYKRMNPEQQYKTIMQLYQELQSPSFYLIEWQEKIHLSLVPLGEIRQTFEDPVHAINTFFLTYLKEGQLKSERQRAISQLSKDLNRGLRYIENNRRKLKTLQEETNYRVLADLIMANLHRIKGGEKTITVDDLYHPGEKVEIRLKPELSPQKNAEIFYRKAKNQHIQIENLARNIKTKERDIEKLKDTLDSVKRTESLQDLRRLIGLKGSSGTKGAENLPYHLYHWQGFQVWLGKSGKSNDEMLRRSRKDDLWLHAKDVAGSHVIIRQKPGSGYPRQLKMKAAALAAFHSKRRSDSLCPVIATARKYIRKRKGSLPGEVAVDREEEILLVEPFDWT